MLLSGIVKPIARIVAQVIAKPLVQSYLKRDRYYQSHGIHILVKRGVFHPGFFFSTSLLMKELRNEKLSGKTLLELGAGSGFISFYAVKQGAQVTATDIHPVAIEGLKYNMRQLQIPEPMLTIIRSDLFEGITAFGYDYIVLNPPFYAGSPKTDSEHAWYAGEKLEYFTRLFAGMHKYVHAETITLMVFPDITELERVKKIAADHQWSVTKIKERNLLYEKMMLFQITRSA